MVIDNVAKHLPADGSAGLQTIQKYHNAFNGGEENRIHLVMCIRLSLVKLSFYLKRLCYLRPCWFNLKEIIKVILSINMYQFLI